MNNFETIDAPYEYYEKPKRIVIQKLDRMQIVDKACWPDLIDNPAMAEENLMDSD